MISTAYIKKNRAVHVQSIFAKNVRMLESKWKKESQTHTHMHIQFKYEIEGEKCGNSSAYGRSM